MKPIVLLDVDGVICNFTKLYLRCAKRVGVLPPDFDEEWHPDSWNIGDALNLTVDGRTAVWKLLAKSGAASDGIEAYEGAVAGVKEIMLLGVDVYFPTASFEASPTWEYDRRAWFREHFSKEVADRLIFTQHKHVVHGDVLVDDKLENILSWQQTQKRGRKLGGILWPHTYNINPPVDVFRAEHRDWSWLHSVVKRLV